MSAQSGSKRRENWALTSLDAIKAFDSIAWPFLYQVLDGLGFGLAFTQWICFLYKSPKAAVLVYGAHSQYFSLYRGTRQGCPLSPLLFALAIESLAIILREDPLYKVITIGARKDRIASYDLLLIISDPELSLPHAIGQINTLGGFLG